MLWRFEPIEVFPVGATTSEEQSGADPLRDRRQMYVACATELRKTASRSEKAAYFPPPAVGAAGGGLKLNIPNRSLSAGLFCGTYGFAPLTFGLGKLSRLRFVIGPSFQFRSMNFRSETWSP